MFVAEKNYENDNLEPVLSKETLEYHFGKHHVGYAAMLNSLVQGTKFEGASLQEIVLQKNTIDSKIYNNAAQIFNHDFYWKSMRDPKRKSVINDIVLAMLEKTFACLENFYGEYISFASSVFGSGWSWLVLDKNHELSFLNTSNADSPVLFEKTPVLVIDLWEHAYYIDYRNDRKAYIQAVVRSCLNFDFAAKNIILACEKFQCLS